MIPNAHSPALIVHSVVDALLTGMASTFKRVACERARRPGAMTLSNEDRIRCMAEMMDVNVCARLVGTNTIAWRCWQAETIGGHSIRVSFEGYDREAVG